MEQTSKKQQPGNITNKQKTKGSAVERSRILSWSWQNKSETKTKQKHFPEKQSANKKNGLAMMKMHAERDDRVVFLLIFFNNLVDCNYSTK